MNSRHPLCQQQQNLDFQLTGRLSEGTRKPGVGGALADMKRRLMVRGGHSFHAEHISLADVPFKSHVSVIFT